MRFGPLPPREAEGGILAHSVRLPDGTVLRKGRRIGASETEMLTGSGVPEIWVAMLDPDDVPEDEAAGRVAHALAGPGTETRTPGTGRCNVVATHAGLLTLDTGCIRGVNEIDEGVTVSTLHDAIPVQSGDLVATVKVIPFSTPAFVVDACLSAAARAAALRVAPYRAATAALVSTTVPGTSERVLGRGEEALRQRIERLGGTLERAVRCPHDATSVASALEEAGSAGCDLLLVLGASAVGDRADVVPEAVRRADGRILRLGIPVDPGNLTLLAELGDVPVLGVPGCARSPRRNGFDWILERILAGRTLEELDVPGLGIGGLLKESPQRPSPRRARRAARPSPRVAGVVLAAGRSARMGNANKLLVEIDGAPMVRHVVETALAAPLEPVVVVLGHEADAVRRALTGLPVAFVENPDYRDGMSTSIARGIDAVSGACDGAMILLGDMPWISERDLTGLTDAFAPDEGRGICAPVADRKRGNPILWAARYFPELRALSGDVGARHILSMHDDDLCEVPVAGEGVLRDVDTPDALDVPSGPRG